MQAAVSNGLARRVGWIVAAIVLLFLAWWLAVHIPKTIAIFVIAAFIAFGVGPIVQRLERRMPKAAAIGIVFAALMVIIALLIVIVVPLTVEQMQTLASNLPGYAATTQDWIAGLETSLEQHFPQLNLPTNGINIQKIGTGQVSAVVTGLISGVGAIAINTATGFFVAFSAVILSIFFLLNDSQIAEGFASMFPPKRRDTARSLAAEVTNLFGSYISGQVIVSAITGLVVAIVTALFGFKFSLIIGIITAVAYAIPIIGMFIAQVVAIPLSIPQGWGVVIGVQAVMFFMARISDNVLVPKIMGESVGVSPIVAFFAVFAGGELFGIPGLILGIPVAALLKILWRYFVAPWIQAQYKEPLPKDEIV
ncbi:MAG TPA: AI-2E family transporter [Candidatus Baltobacteraceae bacterium]|nr:AI-2E family transporter [Candidatus Baltobacteraceae bacterium]